MLHMPARLQLVLHVVQPVQVLRPASDWGAGVLYLVRSEAVMMCVGMPPSSSNASL